MARYTSIVFLAAIVCMAQCSLAFLPTGRLPATPSFSRHAVASRSMSVAAPQRKRAGALTMAKDYWEGEWVCADCGYIYDVDTFSGVRFEDQKAGFKCPQCSGPRRRFAKKVGEKIGLTKDGGDAPIVLFSIVGGLAVIGFGVYAALSGL